MTLLSISLAALLAGPPADGGPEDGDREAPAAGEDSPGERAGDEAELSAAEAEAAAALDELLEAGGRAYQLGDFDGAIERFEQAYELSGRAPLLYNLALAYFRRHDSSGEIEDLHRARALLTNFEIALRRDPELGDADNVADLLAKVEDRIAAEEQTVAAREAEAREQERQRADKAALAAVACERDLQAEAAAELRRRRIAGTLLGAGGASFAGGIASIAAFAVRGRQYGDQLRVLQAERAGLGCDGPSPSPTCADYGAAIDATVVNGRRANIYAAAVGGSLTAVGAAGLIAGTVLLLRERKAGARVDRRAALRVVPSFGGLSLVGRF